MNDLEQHSQRQCVVVTEMKRPGDKNTLKKDSENVISAIPKKPK